MHIALGSDHAGFRLKQEIIAYLQSAGTAHRDYGVDSEESADYPDIAVQVVRAIQCGAGYCGILICGTGIGMAIVANKHPGIRAALCSEPYSARLAREHNNANIITLGSRVIGPGLAVETVKSFLASTFEGGRHQGRIDKIERPGCDR